MLFRYLQSSHSLAPELESHKIYDKLVIPNQNIRYQYERGSRYIRLTEQKINADLFFPDYHWHYQSGDSKVVKSYLLDGDLGVIWEGPLWRDFHDELVHLEDQNQVALDDQEAHQEGFGKRSRKGYQQLPKLCYVAGKYQIPNLSLPPIQYCSYPNVNDFVIGRHKFTRNYQSHQIASDSISKQHCQISHFKSNNIKVASYLKTIYRVLNSVTQRHSHIRRVPADLWSLIFEYLKPRERYAITDLGSRNGTWVSEMGRQVYQLEQNYDYQFENESYSIHISKMYTSANSEGESVLQHNRKAQQIVEQYKKQINWNYYERANKIMIVQDTQNISIKSDQKIQILIFKLKYRDYHEYYLLAVNENFEKKYTVGCKYDIDINPEEYDSPSLHGRIYVHQGRWMIDSYELKRNGEYRKVWIKLVKNCKYVLDVKKGYKIRLGTLFNLGLEFCGF